MTSDHIKAVANDIGEDAASSAKSAASAGGDSLSKARDVANDAGAKAKNLYGQARDRLHDATDGVPDRASDAITAGRRAYRDGSKTVGRQVSKQPIEALLLAGAIGYLVGWASNRS